jgi:hypothetical protein
VSGIRQTYFFTHATAAFLIDFQTLGLEQPLHDRHRQVRITGATHENIHGSKIALGPCVNGNVAFPPSTTNTPTTPAIGREMVKMAVQDRSAQPLPRGFAQGLVDPFPDHPDLWAPHRSTSRCVPANFSPFFSTK